jgi:hypothetical protein
VKQIVSQTENTPHIAHFKHSTRATSAEIAPRLSPYRKATVPTETLPMQPPLYFEMAITECKNVSCHRVVMANLTSEAKLSEAYKHEARCKRLA